MSERFKNARILVTNDDGIHAEGLAVLEAVARSFSDDVWVIAPEREQSGAGHSLTMHEPIRMRELAPKRYEVSGTPTDCVLMAVMEIARDKPFSLVLSGVNRGANVAEDVTYSGTIAAAMEGTLLDIPSIAFSRSVTSDAPIDWSAVASRAPQLIATLGQQDWPHSTLININFPDCADADVRGVKLCPHGRRRINEKLEKHIDPRGKPYFWIAGPSVEPYEPHPEADYHQLADKFITVTPLSLDLTHHLFLKELQNNLSGNGVFLA
jgi:5'-nucleotidase